MEFTNFRSQNLTSDFGNQRRSHIKDYRRLGYALVLATNWPVICFCW